MDIASLLPIAIKASILLMVLGIGFNASWRDSLYLLQHPSLLLRSMLSMYVIMPLVAAGIVTVFDMPIAVEIALVALAISPVPPVLPKKQMTAGGHASYAISLLVVMAVLAIVTVPIAATWLANAFGRQSAIVPLAVAKVVLASVLAPLAAGMALRHFAPAFAARIARPVATLGMILLLLCAVPVMIATAPEIYKLFGDGNVLVIALVVVIGLAIGHVMGGPVPDDRTVLALSTATRHPAVALAVALAVGAESKSGLAAVLLYMLIAIVVCIPYVKWRRRQWAALQPTESI